MHKNNGFITLLLIIPLFIAVSIAGIYFLSKNNGDKYEGPDNPPFTYLTTPYSSISDLSQIGPYSSNYELAGYIHNGIDFMSANDLTEYRAILGGKVIESKVFYDTTRTDTHPQVNVIVQYNKDTIVVYTFEPYSKNVADAERQLSLMSIKAGDTISAGQPIGKLIKTAPQSHVHIHIQQDKKEFCFANMFSKSEQAEMLDIVLVATGKVEQLCYE